MEFSPRARIVEARFWIPLIHGALSALTLVRDLETMLRNYLHQTLSNAPILEGVPRLQGCESRCRDSFAGGSMIALEDGCHGF